MAEDARRWLLESGIRSDMSGPLEHGAVRRGYDIERDVLMPFYPEITGYAVQFHLRWRCGQDGGRDRTAASESGEWLTKIQADRHATAPGAFPFSIENGSAKGGFFTFDSAVIGHALIDLGEATGEERYFVAADRAARWVLRQQLADGSFRAGIGGAPPVSWASDGNCLHGKVAVFLGRMWQKTGEKAFRNSALALLEWVMRLQKSDGAIFTSHNSEYVFSHAHCYAIEGMLAGALYLGEQAFIEPAARGADFLAAVQRRNGGVPRHLGRMAEGYLRECGARLPRVRALFPPSDVGATAQAIRIWTWLRALGVRDYAPQVVRGLTWLERIQLRHGSAAIRGGFPAGVDPLRPWRNREMRLYPWVAIFAADSVRLQAGVNVAADLY